jgi:hypothetical protein
MANRSQLEIIQGAINRLAGNSSAFKGWMVTIISALLGVAINNSKPLLALLAMYAILVLAALDGYYLALERSYRELYKTAAEDPGQEQWSMAIASVGLGRVLAAFASPSIWLFYGSAIIVAIIVVVTA